uniref:DNA primase n=1 Tax=Ochrobactrum phage ORM_20 TaxID=2985243 RepID=A0A9N6ZGD8_9VIRU|nr:hypothetical protein ORM20_00012 [Ochrobactrum phage ORM_20]
MTMSNEIDSINRISYGLQLFEWVSNGKAIFRCPLCGDSKKDHTKRRGAFYTMGGPWMFSCFNCDNEGKGTTTYRNFLQRYDPAEYEYFRLGRLRSDLQSSLNMKKSSDSEKKIDSDTKSSFNELFDSSIFSNLMRLDQLHPEHEAREYVRGRRIPKHAFERLYYAHDFAQWAIGANPNLMEKDKRSGEGIIIPLVNGEGVEFGYQCRFLKGKFRYMTHMLNTSDVKCFGLNWLQPDGDINVTEGVFDSFYFKNSIASLDGSLHNTCDKLVEKYGIEKSRFVLWFDFEPGNRDVAKAKSMAIEAGYRVAFVRKLDAPYKDVNKIIEMADDPIKALKSLKDNAIIEVGSRARIAAMSPNVF